MPAWIRRSPRRKPYVLAEETRDAQDRRRLAVHRAGELEVALAKRQSPPRRSPPMRGSPASVGGLAAVGGRRRTFVGGEALGRRRQARGGRAQHPVVITRYDAEPWPADIQASRCDRIAEPAQTLASLMEDAAPRGLTPQRDRVRWAEQPLRQRDRQCRPGPAPLADVRSSQVRLFSTPLSLTH
jgi:hypothetical protein